MRDAEIQASKSTPREERWPWVGVYTGGSYQTVTTQTSPIGREVAVQTDPVVAVESTLKSSERRVRSKELRSIQLSSAWELWIHGASLFVL